MHRLDLGLYSHPKEFLGNGFRTHDYSKKNPLYHRLRGGLNPQRCITQDSEPNTLPTELFQPPTGIPDSGLNSFIQRQTMMFTKFQKKRASTSWCLWRAQRFTLYYINMTDDDKKKAHVKKKKKKNNGSVAHVDLSLQQFVIQMCNCSVEPCLHEHSVKRFIDFTFSVRILHWLMVSANEIQLE